MLILILLEIQYSQNVDFSFEKGSNGQNHSPSDSYSPDRRILPQLNFPLSSHLITHSVKETRQQKEQWEWRWAVEGEGDL